jgi:hypothetical protein
MDTLQSVSSPIRINPPKNIKVQSFQIAGRHTRDSTTPSESTLCRAPGSVIKIHEMNDELTAII